MKTKTIRGFRKFITLQIMKMQVFFHYLAELLQGKIGFGLFLRLLRRLLYFLTIIKKNKFFRYNNKLRIDLYIPYFGTPAFWQAADKFKAVHTKLACTTVLMSVTKACRFHCDHCYQRFDKGKDTPVEPLTKAAKSLQNQGIAFFNIEGGEPFLRYPALKELCTSIDMRSEIWVNSTGDQMNTEKLEELKTKSPLAGVMFSMHNAEPEVMNSFMHSSTAWQKMEEGVELCHRHNITPAVNACLPKSAFYDRSFEKLMDKASELGIVMIQIIHPKPAGEWLNNEFEKFSKKDILHAQNKIRQYNTKKEYRSYPAIYAQIDEESPEMYGCTAGGTDRFYINAKGDVQPCEFLQLSYGNINTEDFDTIYQRMREDYPTENQNWLCEQLAPEISRILKGKKDIVLPLSPELSQQVMKKANRGPETPMYKKVREK